MTRVALIAPDDEKPEMVAFARAHRDFLDAIEVVCTGTIGRRLASEVDIDVERKASGPRGGDLQIGAEVAEGRLDAVVFLQDPLTAQPHEPDISALLRICDVHDTPLATTRSGAEYLLAGLGRERA